MEKDKAKLLYDTFNDMLKGDVTLGKCLLVGDILYYCKINPFKDDSEESNLVKFIVEQYGAFLKMDYTHKINEDNIVKAVTNYCKLHSKNPFKQFVTEKTVNVAQDELNKEVYKKIDDEFSDDEQENNKRSFVGFVTKLFSKGDA